jgi:hypothetical protein
VEIISVSWLPRIFASAAVILSAFTLVTTFADPDDPQGASAPQVKTGNGALADDRDTSDEAYTEAYRRKEEALAWRREDQIEEGLLAAYLPKHGTAGEPLTLTLSLRNFGERIGGFNCGNTRMAFQVWMRDSGGKPVAKGRSYDEPGRADLSSSGAVEYREMMEPGCGWGLKIPLEKFFDLSHPGRYELVARFGYTFYSKHLSVEIKPLAEESRALAPMATKCASVERTRFGEGVPFDWQWKAASSVAGQEHGGLALEATLSPWLPRAVALVVSLTNVGTRAIYTGHWAWSCDSEYSPEDGVKTDVGLKATDYRLLLRDSAGNAVPLTPEGRAWLRRQVPCRPPAATLGRIYRLLPPPGNGDQPTSGEALLRPGDAIGFTMPLDRLFPLEAGRQYSVMVVLPGKRDKDPVWASPVVRVVVPMPEIAGVDRPLYGSDRIWDRIVPTAGLTRGGVRLRTIIGFFPRGCVNMRLQAIAPGNEETPRGLNMMNSMTECSAILIRDSRGVPVLTNWYEGHGWWTGLSEVHIGGNRPYQEQPQAENPRRQELVYMSDTGLGGYHLVPGERYTLLAAVGVNHNDTGEAVPAESLLVAPPVTFEAPAEDVESPHWGDGFTEKQTPAVIPKAPRPIVSAQQRWKALSRFAGKSFRGFLLEASSPSRGELLVTLRNYDAKDYPYITKWSGQSGYEILIRDPEGKSVRLTEKGERSFQGGRTLGGQILLKGNTIKETLPVGDLFDMHAPGEYTVLASLPVIGDTIDAVLTAAPVKIRIDAPKAEAKSKK